VGSFVTGFLTILSVILAFATLFLAYLLSDRSKEADTFRTKANQSLREAAKFLDDAKRNKEAAAQYLAELAHYKNEAEKFKHDLEEYQEIADQYKKEAEKHCMEAEALHAKLEALKNYECIEDTSLWIAETTRQMQNYIEDVRRYANELIEQAQQQARQQAQSITEDEIVA
jgi:ABC-type transporter Mla subunit MlaD